MVIGIAANLQMGSGKLACGHSAIGPGCRFAENYGGKAWRWHLCALGLEDEIYIDHREFGRYWCGS